MAPTKKPPATSQAAQLVALLDAVPFYRLARTPDEELWYKPGNGHWLRVGSPEFESFALSLWIAVRKNVPLMKITSEAAAALKARVLHPDPDGTGELSRTSPPVYRRAVRHSYVENDSGTTIFLDIGTPNDTSAYEIRAGKVSISPNPQIVFERPEGTLPLPALTDDQAECEQALVNFKELLRLSDNDFVLLMIFLLASIAPSPKRFLLALGGLSGSGKTELARMVRSVIDPSVHSEVTKPSKEEDFHAGCHHCYVYVVDNVSSVPVWFVDSLCCLLTGASATSRKFYAQGQVHRSRHTRPAILTSISDVVWREDLGLRTIPITVPPITDADRRSDADLQAGLEALLPGLLGALLNAAAQGLAHPVNGAVHHRQQDLIDWCVSCAAPLGITSAEIADALAVIDAELSRTHLEASPIAPAMEALSAHMAETGTNTQWLTTTELFEALQGLVGTSKNAHWAKSEHWPRSPRSLGHKLRDVTRSLFKIGIKISPKRTKSARGWEIDVTDYQPNTRQPSPLSVLSPVLEADDDVVILADFAALRESAGKTGTNGSS